MRHAFRQLLHDRGLTVVVVLTVALGVGVNTGIFSLVNCLHRPLPVRDAARLVVLATRRQAAAAGSEGMEYRFTWPAFAEFRAQARSFSDLIAFKFNQGGISDGGKPQEFFFSFVTGNYFSALGIPPAAGRLFAPGEGETADAPMRLVLGYSFWQKRFGGDPAVVGRQVRINGAPATIIGVADRRFHGTYANAEMAGYVPIGAMTSSENGMMRGFFHDRTAPRLTVMGMLKPGVRMAQARSEAEVIARRLERQYPDTDKGIGVWILPEPWARPVPSMVAAGPFLAGLFLLLGLLVLALACVNVGNILLVRAATREREMAVRAALGAGRARLVRQTLVESLLLAVLGGAGGILLGAWAGAAANSVPVSDNLPAALDLSFDWRVFAYALAATLLAGIGAGLWPALAASRADVAGVLHACGRSGTAARGSRRLRSGLVVVQVAGSLTLLIVAGIFARSLAAVRRMDLGFDPGHLAVFTMDANYAGYDKDRAAAFYRDLERRVGRLPGIESVSLSFREPMSYSLHADALEIEGRPPAPVHQRPLLMFDSVTPDYFRTMRIDLRRGRVFREGDGDGAPRVAVVNETMARRLWPNQDPLGKRFRMERRPEWWEVVGMARDGRYLMLFESPQPFFYVPTAQFEQSRRVLEVRSNLAAAALLPRVEAEIRALDPDMPVTESRTMEDVLDGFSGFWGYRLGAWLSGAMGLVGLALAVVGVYGVVSYAAGQRTREIGIRLALGADRRDVLRLVLGQGAALVAYGVLAGSCGAWVLARLMNGWLYGTIHADPAAFVVTGAFLAALTLWACYVPARRAVRMDPTAALRHE
jgi:predicted permease